MTSQPGRTMVLAAGLVPGLVRRGGKLPRGHARVFSTPSGWMPGPPHRGILLEATLSVGMLIPGLLHAVVRSRWGGKSGRESLEDYAWSEMIGWHRHKPWLVAEFVRLPYPDHLLSLSVQRESSLSPDVASSFADELAEPGKLVTLLEVMWT